MAWAAMSNKATGDLVTEADMDAIRGNIEYLLDPSKGRVVVASGTYSTTSTSFVAVNAAVSITLETHGGPVFISASGVVSVDTTPHLVKIGINIDGTVYPSSTLGGYAASQANTDFLGQWHITDIVPLAAGSHTIQLVWNIDAGTATMTMTAIPLVMNAIEL